MTLLTVSATPASATPETDLLAPSRVHHAELEARLEGIRGLPRKARLLLDLGRHDEAWALVPELLADENPEGTLQAAAILFAVHDYEQLAPLAEALTASRGEDPEVRRISYKWWFLIDDLEQVERTLERRGAAGTSQLVDDLARARLQTLMLKREAAQSSYEAALAAATTDEERASALHGLGVVLHRRLDFDGAFARLREALSLTPLDADLLAILSNTLIRLSRTDEAIDVLEMAVRLAPYHESAHYMLGNGYARKNYTQMFQAYPEAFNGEDGADVSARRGSLAFAERRFDDARRHFVQSLKLCPEYGRAHNGLAKAIEAQRMHHNVHRDRYERRFDDLATPRVEGIEEYVVNWSSLEPRHRKQVALSVAPWARYIPVLLAAGSTHYIKPLHERLSESPQQDLMSDLRISYDSRLWDDVRGLGGYHTVTGLEDVERIRWNGYNTVLHELTHQVHQVLTAEDNRRIQDLYRKTKGRDEKKGSEIFLSRYAAGSVWEYFAEGANSLASPKRDRFDTREIVRERLEEKDQELLALVQDLMNKTDLAGPYTVALVNRASNQIRRGRAEDAITVLRQALERSPDSEEALSSLVGALAAAGRAEESLELAEAKALDQPESAALAMGHASSLWLAGRGLDVAQAVLAKARDRVREEERYQVDLERGWRAVTAGDAAAARKAFEAVLSYQSDHPQGLWGLASAYALAGEWSAAWPRYEEAVRHRTGIVPLRVAYAWDLLRAGELEQARGQLDAALLLDPEDPELLAVEALWLLANDRLLEALRAAERALEIGAWCDTARVALAASLIRSGREEKGREVLSPLEERIHRGDPPVYLYRQEKGSWVLTHTLPALLRREVATLAHQPNNSSS